ncbi:MAG TPA: CpsB/CapC family capsule biosynthesis tyrosine phosphatase [Solirubrobacteraceae bacterium]
MIDLHSHILPGIDDGASDMASAVAMAREASSKGIRKVVATPHVDHKYDTRASTIKSLVASLNEELARKSVRVEVLTGAEVAAYRLADLGERELCDLGLGGGPYTLVEAPLSSTVGDFEIFLDEPGARGRRYVLAHPERSPHFQRDPDRLRRLVLSGVLVSITASALSGRFGGSVRRFAVSLLELGLVHNVASDMHDVSRRPPGIAEHLRAVSPILPGIVELENWLTYEVPASVIAGRPVMMPPRLVRSRRRAFGLGRIVGYSQEH